MNALLDNDVDNRRKERLKRLGILTEPLGYPDGVNRYEFVGDGPLANVDPLGLAEERITDPGRNRIKLPIDDGAGHKGEVNVNTDVTVEYLKKIEPREMGARSNLLSAGYAGTKCDECHWVQLFWEEVIVSRGDKRTSKEGIVKSTSGDVTLTTDPKDPIWSIDGNPEYDGMDMREKGSITFFDRPDFNIENARDALLADDFKAGGVTFVRHITHFQSFLVCGGKVAFGFEWTQSNSWNPKDGPFGWRIDVPKDQKGDLGLSPGQISVIRKAFPKQGVIKFD